MRRAALTLAMLAALAGPALADDLILSLSHETVTIASNYQGAEVAVFGAALDGEGDVRPAGPYDLIVTTRGPLEVIDVREKERVGGVWVNTKGREFVRAPSFLSVLASRPVAEMADEATRARDDLGLDAAAAGRLAGAGPNGPSAADRPFVAALRRLQESRGLWREDPRGVDFIGASLFQGSIRLPPNVPFGEFEVEARLMQDGLMLARRTVSFRVVKSGFEAQVAGVSETNRLAYGVAVVALALLFGWLASVIFRRD